MAPERRDAAKNVPGDGDLPPKLAAPSSAHGAEDDLSPAELAAAEAFDRIHQEYCEDPSEQKMREAVKRHLTGDNETDQLIKAMAFQVVLLSRAKRNRESS